MKKFVAIFTVVFLLVGACQPLVKTGGTFRTALGIDPPAIDPANAIEVAGAVVGQQLFDGLVKYNPKTLVIEPAVAVSWKISADAKTYTFKLRKGTKFHNGEEVIANSFKRAFDFTANPKNQAQAAYFFETIEGYEELQQKEAEELKGVQAVDKYTLRIRLSKPSADFLATLTNVAFSPLPKAASYPKFAKLPVGNGPFSFVSWKRNKEIVLQKFSGYYGQKAIIKKVIFKIYNDENVALRDFKAGNLEDTSIPPNQVNLIAKDYVQSQNIVRVNLLSTYSYGFNLKKKPWNNKKLRLAIASAIDRDSLIDKTQPQDTQKAVSFTPRSVFGNNRSLIQLETNLGKVRELVKEAGFSKPSDVAPITISYITGGRNDKVAQVIQNQLQKAGFKAKIEGLEPGAFFDKMLGGELDFFQMKWVAEPSFGSFLQPIFATESIGINNVTNYSNKQVDELLTTAQSTLNQKKRITIYQSAERKILADVPVIPLFYDTANYLVKPYVKDYHRNAFDEPMLDEVWMMK